LSDEGRSQWARAVDHRNRCAEVGDGERRGRDETGSTKLLLMLLLLGHRGLGNGGGDVAVAVVVVDDKSCGGDDGGGGGDGDVDDAPVDVTRCPRWRTARPVRRTRVGRTTEWG